MRPSLIRGLGLAALILLTGFGVTRPPHQANAFALRGANLDDARRWNSEPGSLVGNGVRGLGGGLEYAIASDFCDRLIPLFQDELKPTCADLKAAIQGAFDQWSAGHPILRFVDVSDRVPAQLMPAGASATKGYGAEIDLVASSPAAQPRIAGFFGATSTYSVAACVCDTSDIGGGPPRATNGDHIPTIITNADIEISDAGCYTMDPTLARYQCDHFASLIVLMAGQAIGVDSSMAGPERNLDTDDDPMNAIVIDCKNPTNGLRPSRAIDETAAMNTHPRSPAAPAMVNGDDRAARDFLYPVC